MRAQLWRGRGKPFSVAAFFERHRRHHRTRRCC
jgi:hypothetical protein